MKMKMRLIRSLMHPMLLFRKLLLFIQLMCLFFVIFFMKEVNYGAEN